jgi:hypothetical protein
MIIYYFEKRMIRLKKNLLGIVLAGILFFAGTAAPDAAMFSAE